MPADVTKQASDDQTSLYDTFLREDWLAEYYTCDAMFYEYCDCHPSRLDF